MKATPSELRQRHCTTIEMCIHDAFSAMSTYRMTHERAMEWLNKQVYQRPEWRKMGAWKQTYCCGIIDECWHRWRHTLTWCFKLGDEYVPAHEAEKHPSWPGWKELNGDDSRMCYAPDATHPTYTPIQ